MNNLKKNLTRVLALVLIAATLSLAICSCGKNISDIEVMKTEHFSVSAGMLTYSLYDSYYYYVTSFGAEMMKLYFGIDTAVSLKKQYYDETKTITWFDVFKTDAVDGFSNALALCEAAYADGITLSDVDNKYIQGQIDEIAAMAAEENMSLADYIEYIYTDGVTENDIRRSLEIYRLASKKRYKDFSEIKVTEGEINDDLKENGEKYLMRDIIYLELALSNETEKNEKIKEYAENLKATTNAEDFKALANEFIDSEYCVDSKKDDNINSNDKKVISETVQNNVEEDDKTDVDIWFFASGTTVGSTYLYESNTSYIVYMAVSEAAMDTAETRDIYTIIISEDVYGSDEAAKAKADAIYQEWQNSGENMETFKALAAQYTTDYVSVYCGGYYANVMKDDLIEALDEWLFDEALEVGASTIIKTNYGYHLMVYTGTGEPAWKVPIIETIKNDKTTKNINKYVDTYTVTTIEGNMKYVQGE